MDSKIDGAVSVINLYAMAEGQPTHVVALGDRGSIPPFIDESGKDRLDNLVLTRDGRGRLVLFATVNVSESDGQHLKLVTANYLGEDERQKLVTLLTSLAPVT